MRGLVTRRRFAAGLASGAFAGLALSGCGGLKLRDVPDLLSRVPKYRDRMMRRVSGYGALVEDEAGLLDLPPGFDYTIVSPRGPGPKGHGGGPLTVGGVVLDAADGMGSFRAGADHRVVLVRNHESSTAAGTTTLLYDCDSFELVDEYRSLAGTRRNCAGGATPWGSWLSCEEDVGQGHGHVYEVPALDGRRAARAPLVHLGRFNHEAAAVDPDPKRHITYMTEDRVDGLFYRWLPDDPRRALAPAGRLEALAFADPAYGGATSNWGDDDWAIGDWRDVVWRKLDARDTGRDDLRSRGHELGAARFACGEGVHFGDGELYFCVTSGGRIKSGQIMRYVPDPRDVARGRLQLFLESTDPAAFNYADNLVVAPNGHLIVCEDPYVGGESNYLLRDIAKPLGAAAPCYLRGVTPDGAVYDIARLHGGSELAGVCFAPNGRTLFVNVYSPATTLAIRGDWGSPRPGWAIPEAGRLTDWSRGLPAAAA